MIRNAANGKKRGKTLPVPPARDGKAGVVTHLSAESAWFEPEAFFRRAAERLSDASRRAAGGDHVLNPGMTAHPSYTDAAVLIPIVASSPLSVLFTRRTPRLSAHAGQVAFPGGKIDPTDADAAAAALREAEEEIGLDRRSVAVIGTLDPYFTATGYRVIPVVARVAAGSPLRINHEEVEEVFEVPLAFLLERGNMQRKSRAFAGRERHFYEMTFDRHTIWGATAGIIRALSERIFG
jgi:8-oxo-dGTP pyrophosphatase MutT (NUDIX family)